VGTQLSGITDKPAMGPPRIVAHGGPGVGKTSFGADAPGALVMPIEDGLGVLQVAHLAQPESFEDVINAIVELVNEKHDYKTLVVDTIDHLEPLIWQKVCADNNKANIESFGYGKGYTFADPLWIQFFKGLDALRRKGMTTIVLCHNAVTPIDDPVIGTYSRYTPKIQKRANALLYEWADIVAFMDIERTVAEKGEDKGRKTRTSQTTSQRVLHLEDRGGFVAKNRFGLPPTIMLPKEHPYQAFRKALITTLGLDKKKKAAEPEAPAGEEKE
jgi:hypothetical protein